MESEGVEGGPTVPEIGDPGIAPPPRVWIIRPRSKRGVLVVSLSPRVYSYGTHYVPQITADRPCQGEWNACHWCRDGYEWREKHYLAALLAPGWTPGLLELTEKGVAHCPQLRDRSRNWRGFEVRAWRLYDRPNAPLQVRVGGRRSELALPAEPDVHAALLYYWGFRAQQPQPPHREDGP